MFSKISIEKTALTALLFMWLLPLPAFSQKVSSQITKREDKNIKEKAQEAVKTYMRLLSAIADPTLPNDDLDEIISNAFIGDGTIFYKNDFKLESDAYPVRDPDNAIELSINDYLHQFRNFYIQKGPNSVQCQITDVSGIKVGENYLFLKVYYTETQNGATAKGEKFPKTLRVITLAAIPRQGQYQTLITAVDFADKVRADSKAPNVTITDAASGEASGETSHSDAYYNQALQNGTRYLKESNYADAYVSLSEAKKNRQTETEAGSRVDDLYSKLRGQDNDPIDYLFNSLIQRGQALSEKYRYEEAKLYLSYAKEIKPSGSKAAGVEISAVNDREAKEQLLWKLYDQGAYADAVKGFQKAIDKGQTDNPSMYIGLGRSYQALGNDDDAGAAFASAIKADPAHAESYKWYGYFLKYKKDYRNAMDAFVNYQSRADDPSDPIVASEVAFCRGMQAFDRHENQQALDFLTTAVTQNSNNREANLALARVYLDQRDLKSAKKVIKSLLDKDNSYAEAYYWQAKILEAENDKIHAEESYRQAINYDPKAYVYYYDLGKIQMEPELAKYQEAIQNFSICINSAVKMPYTKVAYWKRATCYYNLGNKDEESYQDFKKADALMPMRPASFYVEYANLLIRTKQYDKAMENLSHASTDPAANLSMGVLSYIQFPQDEDRFLNYFERAFRDGVSADAVKNNPTITELYSNNRKFKSLVKKYKYSSLL